MLSYAGFLIPWILLELSLLIIVDLAPLELSIVLLQLFVGSSETYYLYTSEVLTTAYKYYGYIARSNELVSGLYYLHCILVCILQLILHTG